MRLVDRIVAEDLPPPLLAALRDALQAVSGASGFATLEQDLVDGLFDRAELGDVEPAPLDDLWPHAELVLTVALTLAVADGHYGVEEARVDAVRRERILDTPPEQEFDDLAFLAAAALRVPVVLINFVDQIGRAHV